MIEQVLGLVPLLEAAFMATRAFATGTLSELHDTLGVHIGALPSCSCFVPLETMAWYGSTALGCGAEATAP